MNLELKNLKIVSELSQETTAFTATIYRDGKRVGRALNEGHGGPNRYEWDDRQAGQEIQAWAETQDLEFDFDHLDQIVDQLMQEVEVNRWLKRKCAREVLFRLKGDPTESWRTVKGRWSQRVRDYLQQKYGDKIEVIANEKLGQAFARGAKEGN